MSWWTSLRDTVEQYAPVIIAIVAPELAPEIGAAMGFSGAAATAAGSAAISAGVTAAEGGSISDVAKSAVAGGAGSYLGSMAGEAVSSETGSQALGKAAQGATASTSAGLLRGESLPTALKQGAVSGVAGYMFPGSDTSSSASRALTSTALGQFLAQIGRAHV